MPEYRNETDAVITPSGGESVAPGITIYTDKYLIDPGGLTLTRQKEPALDSLHADVLPVSIASGLAKYPQIWITNNSGDLVEVYFNGDATKPLPLMDGAVYPLTQDRDVDALSISGDGSGKVYVTAFKV